MLAFGRVSRAHGTTFELENSTPEVSLECRRLLCFRRIDLSSRSGMRRVVAGSGNIFIGRKVSHFRVPSAPLGEPRL